MLIQQLAEVNTASASDAESSNKAQEESSEKVQALELKVKLLEKDLFYYKKTSRELKKRLQQETNSGGDGSGDKGRRREEEGREAKKKSTHTEYCHSRDWTSERLADSLEVGSVNEKSLAVSGTSLSVGAKRQDAHVASVASSSVSTVNHAPPIATPTGETQQQVVRKQKKQLRQLRSVTFIIRIIIVKWLIRSHAHSGASCDTVFAVWLTLRCCCLPSCAQCADALVVLCVYMSVCLHVGAHSLLRDMTHFRATTSTRKGLYSYM